MDHQPPVSNTQGTDQINQSNDPDNLAPLKRQQRRFQPWPPPPPSPSSVFHGVSATTSTATPSPPRFLRQPWLLDSLAVSPPGTSQALALSPSLNQHHQQKSPFLHRSTADVWLVHQCRQSLDRLSKLQLETELNAASCLLSGLLVSDAQLFSRARSCADLFGMQQATLKPLLFPDYDEDLDEQEECVEWVDDVTEEESIHQPAVSWYPVRPTTTQQPVVQTTKGRAGRGRRKSTGGAKNTIAPGDPVKPIKLIIKPPSQSVPAVPLQPADGNQRRSSRRFSHSATTDSATISYSSLIKPPPSMSMGSSQWFSHIDVPTVASTINPVFLYNPELFSKKLKGSAAIGRPGKRKRGRVSAAKEAKLRAWEVHQEKLKAMVTPGMNRRSSTSAVVENRLEKDKAVGEGQRRRRSLGTSLSYKEPESSGEASESELVPLQPTSTPSWSNLATTDAVAPPEASSAMSVNPTSLTLSHPVAPTNPTRPVKRRKGRPRSVSFLLEPTVLSGSGIACGGRHLDPTTHTPRSTASEEADSDSSCSSDIYTKSDTAATARSERGSTTELGSSEEEEEDGSCREGPEEDQDSVQGMLPDSADEQHVEQIGQDFRQWSIEQLSQQQQLQPLQQPPPSSASVPGALPALDTSTELKELVAPPMLSPDKRLFHMDAWNLMGMDMYTQAPMDGEILTQSPFHEFILDDSAAPLSTPIAAPPTSTTNLLSTADTVAEDEVMAMEEATQLVLDFVHAEELPKPSPEVLPVNPAPTVDSVPSDLNEASDNITNEAEEFLEFLDAEKLSDDAENCAKENNDPSELNSVVTAEPATVKTTESTISIPERFDTDIIVLQAMVTVDALQTPPTSPGPEAAVCLKPQARRSVSRIFVSTENDPIFAPQLPYDIKPNVVYSLFKNFYWATETDERQAVRLQESQCHLESLKARCRCCTKREVEYSEGCRFQGFRVFIQDPPHEKYRGGLDVGMWTFRSLDDFYAPATFQMSLNHIPLSIRTYIMQQTWPIFWLVLQQELYAHSRLPVRPKHYHEQSFFRPIIPDGDGSPLHAQLCDICHKKIISLYWMCWRCGMDLCIHCYWEWSNRYETSLCSNTHQHQRMFGSKLKRSSTSADTMPQLNPQKFVQIKDDDSEVLEKNLFPLVPVYRRPPLFWNELDEWFSQAQKTYLQIPHVPSFVEIQTNPDVLKKVYEVMSERLDWTLDDLLGYGFGGYFPLTEKQQRLRQTILESNKEPLPSRRKPISYIKFQQERNPWSRCDCSCIGTVNIEDDIMPRRIKSRKSNKDVPTEDQRFVTEVDDFDELDAKSLSDISADEEEYLEEDLKDWQEEASLPFVTINADDLDLPTFQKLWRRGEPILVRNLHKRMREDWTPDEFIRKYAREAAVVYDCETLNPTEFTLEEFFLGFKNTRSRPINDNGDPMTLKLKVHHDHLFSVAL